MISSNSIKARLRAACVSLRRGLLLASLACVLAAIGCSDLPYRIEWGRRPPGAAREEETPAGASIEATAETAWIWWDSQHRDLERVIADAREGAVPTVTFANCRTALGRLEKYPAFPPESMQALCRSYVVIEEDAATATKSRTLSRLREVAKSMRRLHRGAAADSADTAEATE